MDEKDIKLCQVLLNNSRIPYEDLARRLNISINAVHKRVKALQELGIIRAFVARPSLVALNALSVWIYGRSESKQPRDIHLRLQKNDRTYWVAYSGGEQVYVGGYLRDVSELESYASFVRSEALMPELVVGILPSTPKHASIELRQMDYQILSSLHRDSRKSLADVASEIHVTPKTVRNRLERMVDNQLVDLTMDWYPDTSNDIMTIIHLDIAADAKNTSIYSTIAEQFSPNILIPLLFSNLPNKLVAVCWTNTMKQLEDVRTKINQMKGVKNVVMNALQIGYMFDTWRDKLIEEKCNSMPKPSKN